MEIATSIKIDKETWKQFKITAIERDLDYSKALKEAIENWMGKVEVDKK